MRISEIYKSIQGEGLLTGTESVFVRTTGCNLRCVFCDTPYTSWEPEGEHRSIDAIVRQCRELGADHIVLTGGEPMLQSECVPLAERLSQLGRHITIETAGTIYRPVRCDLMSISPKLANSSPPAHGDPRIRERHEASRWRPAVIRQLLEEYDCQVKFVVDRPEDLEEILEWLGQFPGIPRERILLMPQGVDPDELAAREAWIRPLCEQYGFGFCPRMHIVWFGNRRGT